MPKDLDGQVEMFAIEETPFPVSLADRFIVPPFSVLDRRQGAWQDRKRRWLSMGFQSEIGRGDALLFRSSSTDETSVYLATEIGRTSVFDPVLAELAYRWFSAPGDRILDPFAGGSVRGIVASALARWYVGVELRPEQVAANRAQSHMASDMVPVWVEGDATTCDVGPLASDEYDLVFTCPPYAHLEVYSDDPADLSAMAYPDFVAAVRRTMAATYRLLRRDRFAIWIVGDARSTRGAGDYVGLVADTVKAAQSAGFALYNEAIIIDRVGTLAARAGQAFDATRKLGRGHQHMLIFVKGDGRVAGKRAAAGERTGT